MNNPLLSYSNLPPFGQFKPEDVEPALDEILKENRATIINLLQQGRGYTWENLIETLDNCDERLHALWSMVSHLHAVLNTRQLRKIYQTCLPKITEYSTEIGQNEQLYRAIKSLTRKNYYQKLNPAQRKVVDNAIRDFRLSGVALSPIKKQRFAEVEKRLSELTNRFEENVLDATQAWTKHITDAAALTGLPEYALQEAQQAATSQSVEGYWLSLSYSMYLAVMTYAEDRKLREEMYTAYSTRASDQGPHAGQFDNTLVMEEILALRHEEAKLLGYANYAELSLATKMAESPAQVFAFLYELIARAKSQAEREFSELKTFVHNQFGISDLQAWDVAYYSEKLRLHQFALSQEELRPYFALDNVLSGMFNIVERLYGIKITEMNNAEVWHADVRLFAIHDANGEFRGYFYADFYSRQNKRSGAWMDDWQCRRRLLNGEIQHPVAFLICNFSPRSRTRPSLLTHDDAATLFHEFGHTLHHLLTRVDYAGVSGIKGVAWDAVELPSQFMENWCWEKEALSLFAKHYKTNEPLPEELFNRLSASRHFQTAMHLMRQLEFSLFDFRIHLEYEAHKGARINEILETVRHLTAVMRAPKFNRFAHSFSHIFAGGYSAGYYSYKWAEVLSSDAFSLFEEKGIFDETTGRQFLEAILEQGGSAEPMELFIRFRGRRPTIDAFLRHSGILSS